MMLAKQEDALELIRSQIVKACDAHEKYKEQFYNCMNVVLPEYEEKYLIKHVGDDRSKLVLRSRPEFANDVTNFKQNAAANLFEEYLDIVTL